MKLYAMSCGYLRCRKVIFIPTADKGIVMDSPMPAYLITHPEGNVLFDTGPNPVVFDDAEKHWGRLAKVFRPLGDKESGVAAQLENIGVRTGDIKYVVNSHLHFDHAGGNRLFPGATFIVQREELARAPGIPNTPTRGTFGLIGMIPPFIMRRSRVSGIFSRMAYCVSCP